MQRGRGSRLRITSIQMGQKSVPTNFTLAPGEKISLAFDGKEFVVVRELRFPVVTRAVRTTNGRRRRSRRKENA